MSFDEYFKQRKDAALENNKGYQKRKQMTQYERSRDAIDYYTGEIKDYNQKMGREMTHEQAEAEAVKIANRAEKRKDG